MGIRFYCPNGHKLHVKAFQAGKRGICPHCGASMDIPYQSTRKSSKELKGRRQAQGAATARDVVQLIQDEGRRAAASAKSSGRPPGQDFRPKDAPRSVATEPARRPAEPLVPSRETSGVGPPGVTPLDGPPATAPPHVPAPESLESLLAGDRGTSAVRQSAGSDRSDPLADPSEVVWYVRPPSGGQYGPATREVMRKWIREGRVSPDSLVWREGWRDWKEAVAVFPQLSTSDASDTLPELENIIANEMALAWDDGRTTSARRKDSVGSPLWVMGILLGIGLAILLAVFVWVKLS